MYKDIFQALLTSYRWLFAVSKRFYIGAPRNAHVAISMSLISQACMMLAFLLPLKVVMLLGTQEALIRFPFMPNVVEKNLLILCLSIMALFFYSCMHISQRISDKASLAGAKKLFVANCKQIKLKNQQETIERAYSKFISGISGLIFLFFGLIILWALYIDIALIFGLSITMYILCLLVAKHRLQLNESENITGLEWLTDFVFLTIFIYTIADFLYLEPPSFLIAIISVVLTRLLLGRLQFSINQFTSLYKQKQKLNSLFFSSSNPTTPNHETADIWALSRSPQFHTKITQILQLYTSSLLQKIVYEINDSNNKDTVMLVATHQEHGKFLIKLFDKKYTQKAKREALILEPYAEQLPAPKLISATLYEEHPCHVFDITDFTFVDECSPYFERIKTEILKTSINQNLCIENLGKNQQPISMFLTQLDSVFLQRLWSVVNVNEKETLNKFVECIPRIIHVVQSLPLVLEIPMKRQLMVMNKKNTPMLIDWTQWQLMPIASVNLPKDIAPTELTDEIILSREFSEESIQLLRVELELSDLIRQLLLKYEMQKYQEIIQTLLPKIISNIKGQPYNHIK